MIDGIVVVAAMFQAAHSLDSPLDIHLDTLLVHTQDTLMSEALGVPGVPEVTVVVQHIPVGSLACHYPFAV